MDYPDEIADTSEKQPEFVLISSHSLRDFLNELVEDLTDSGMLVVYVGITKTSDKLRDMFEDEGIDTKKILFFDMATKISGSAPDEVTNTVFLDSDDINQLNMRLDDAADSVPEDREAVLVFDTVTTFSIYNDEDTILDFLGSLTSKTTEWNMKTVLVGVDEEMDEELSSAMDDAVSKTYEVKDD